MILHNSRIRHKRTQVSGTTPTIGPSDDFTDDTWVDNDIYPGEFFLDMGGQVGWFGYSGTTSGVGAWFSPDPTPITIDAGTGIIVNQISNLVYSIESVGPEEYVIIEFTWLAGSTSTSIPAIIPTDIPAPTGPSQLISEVFVIMIDTVTYDSHCGIIGGKYFISTYPLRNMIHTYDGTVWSDPTGQGRYADGSSEQGGITNVARAGYEGSIGSTPPVFYLDTILPLGTTIPNDIKVKFVVKYKYLNA
jgi:hypothetical protein